MTYVTLFDLAQKPFRWFYPSFGLVYLAVGVVFALLAWRWSKRRLPVVLGCAMALFAAGWSVYSVGATYRQYRDCEQALWTHRALVVEGVVEEFQPAPFEGLDECFQVKTERFCYSDSAVLPGFQQTASHGGPVRKGLAVRVTYYQGNILRLETLGPSRGEHAL